MQKLSPRLRVVAQLCGGARSAIDVGCDHGFLSAELVLNGGAQHVFAADIRPKPLKRAAATIEALNLAERVTLRLCDGLQGFKAIDADTIAICGMGGDVIAGILQAAPWTQEGNHRLVLQPMTKSNRLRQFLKENNYVIEDERLALEDRRIYCAISARGSPPSPHSNSTADINYLRENKYFLYSDFMKRDPLFLDYLRRLLRICKQALEEVSDAKGDSTQATAIIKILEDEINAV